MVCTMRAVRHVSVLVAWKCHLNLMNWECRPGKEGGWGEGIPLTLHSLTESESISNVYKCTSRDDLSGFLPASPRVLVLDP